MTLEDKIRNLSKDLQNLKRKKSNRKNLRNYIKTTFRIKKLTQQKRQLLAELFEKYNIKIISAETNQKLNILTDDFNQDIYFSIDEVNNKFIKTSTSNKPKLKTNQKNALEKLLQKIAPVETEKSFDWLVSPDKNHLPEEYHNIYKALVNYRGFKSFFRSNYHLKCDFVLEDYKLIVEYDERQHFTEARKISLENYPKNLKFYYPVDKWIQLCEKTKARDNNPKDRDEARAFYDSVRDIEASKNDYKLVRIYDGQYDWTKPEAFDVLLKTLGLENEQSFVDKIVGSTIKNVRNIIKRKTEKFPVQATEQSYSYKIGRLIQTCETSDDFSVEVDKILLQLKDKKVKFLITPGGFYQKYLSDLNSNEDDIEEFMTDLLFIAENFLIDEFKAIWSLKDIADYLTFGFDFYYLTEEYELDFKRTHVELVALIDLKASEIINWTGKFYPTSEQQESIILITNFETKFLEISGDRVLILGCHDLNVFNTRGQTNLKEGSYKYEISQEFYKYFEEFKPEIILQHPHITDSDRIWLNAWSKVKKDYKFVKHFASGIYYPVDSARKPLRKVVESTKHGSVIDIFI